MKTPSVSVETAAEAYLIIGAGWASILAWKARKAMLKNKTTAALTIGYWLLAWPHSMYDYFRGDWR